MKTEKNLYLLIILLFLSGFFSCNELLNEKTFSTLGESNFYRNSEDAEALLNGVYANSQGYRDVARDLLTFGEMTTDIMLESDGAIYALIQPVQEFTWSTTHPWLQGLWVRYYRAIFRANTVIDKVPSIAMDEELKTQIIAEGRFLRALNYYFLLDLFGPTPLILTSETSVTDRPVRANRDEFVNFVRDEFIAVSNILPVIPRQTNRATKGAALGFLCKLYLQEKNWDNVVRMSKELMDLNAYGLFTDGDRNELFDIKNKLSNEFIYVHPFPDNPTGDKGNTYLSHAAPPGYKFQFPPKVNFAAQFKIRSDFLNTFEENDERRKAFLFEYVNMNNKNIILGKDNVRSFKYPEDPNGVGDLSSNDFPLLRYSDILLSRAEALNELNGPIQESIDLINLIRNVAGVENINLSDYNDKKSLREFILEERGREFHTEGLRRQDLIRHGKFIEYAIKRGLNAKEYQILFPIPQSEIDKNENLIQNNGYS